MCSSDLDFKSSAGKTMYVAAHLVTLPGKGHAGIIGVGVGSWINATTSMSPGLLDSEGQNGYKMCIRDSGKVAALCDSGEIEKALCEELAPSADAVEARLKEKNI